MREGRPGGVDERVADQRHRGLDQPVQLHPAGEAARRVALRQRQPAPRHPAPAALYQEGKLKLDELITRTYPLKDINKGYQDMRDGINVRGMLIY